MGLFKPITRDDMDILIRILNALVATIFRYVIICIILYFITLKYLLYTPEVPKPWTVNHIILGKYYYIFLVLIIFNQY